MWQDDIPEIEALLAALIEPSSGSLLRARVARVLKEGKPLKPPPLPDTDQVAEHVRIRDEKIRSVMATGLRSPVRALAVDCETTGLSRYDRIVSFAAVEMLDGRCSDKAIYLVFNPGRKCHPKATEVHGWSDDVLARQPSFKDYALAIRELLTGVDVIVGHNVSFDMEFLKREIRKAGLDGINPQEYCTMMTYRARYPGRRSGLDACLEEIGIQRAGKKHGALEDAFLAASLYSRMQFNSPDYSLPTSWPRPANFRD